MQHAVNALDDFLPRWLADVGVVVGLFVVAWIVSRLAGRAGGWLLARRSDEPVALHRARQRETLTTLARTSVSYLAFGIALVLAIIAVTGARRVETIAGASFVAVIAAFAVQRFLMDVVAGGLMVFERWFAVGDLVSIEPWELLGVVEEMSLRSIKLRSVQGEVIRVSNSQILAVRVIPRGLRQLEIELFVSDLDAGRQLVERLARVVPVGPTHFVRPPVVTETEDLDDGLHRITASAAVAPGREWLAEELLPKLAHERDGGGVIVHGPVVTPVDETAETRFARAVRVGSAGPPPDRSPFERLPFVERRRRDSTAPRR
jgi:hypothetical protein